jgi:hypothetical protein
MASTLFLSRKDHRRSKKGDAVDLRGMLLGDAGVSVVEVASTSLGTAAMRCLKVNPSLKKAIDCGVFRPKCMLHTDDSTIRIPQTKLPLTAEARSSLALEHHLQTARRGFSLYKSIQVSKPSKSHVVTHSSSSKSRSLKTEVLLPSSMILL